MSEQDLLRRFLFEDMGVRGHWGQINGKLANRKTAPALSKQPGIATRPSPIGCSIAVCNY